MVAELKVPLAESQQENFPSYFDHFPSVARLKATPPAFAEPWGFDLSLMESWGPPTPEKDALYNRMCTVHDELLLGIDHDPRAGDPRNIVPWKPYVLALLRYFTWQWMTGGEGPCDIQTARAYLEHIHGNPQHRPYPGKDHVDCWGTYPTPAQLTAWEQWELDQFAVWLANQ